MASTRSKCLFVFLGLVIISIASIGEARASQTDGVPGLRADLTALGDIVAGLQGEMASTKADLAETRRQLTDTQARLAQTQAELSEARAQLAGRLGALETQLAATVVDFDQRLQDQSTNFSHELAAVAAQAAAENARLDALVSDALASLSGAGSSITSLFGSVGSLQTSVGTLNDAGVTFGQTSRAAGDVAFDSIAKELQAAEREMVLVKLARGNVQSSGPAAQEVMNLLYAAQAQFESARSNQLLQDLGVVAEWDAAALRSRASLDQSQEVLATGGSVALLDVMEHQIKEMEAAQETVRNKRQMASTAFQNFDQKANQLYNLLSSVTKAMNEMRMGTVRNML